MLPRCCLLPPRSGPRSGQEPGNIRKYKSSGGGGGRVLRLRSHVSLLARWPRPLASSTAVKSPCHLEMLERAFTIQQQQQQRLWSAVVAPAQSGTGAHLPTGWNLSQDSAQIQGVAPLITRSDVVGFTPVGCAGAAAAVKTTTLGFCLSYTSSRRACLFFLHDRRESGSRTLDASVTEHSR